MKFMGLLKADAASEAGAMPSPELLDRMGTCLAEVTKAGVLLAADGLKPSSEGKRVRLSQGKVSVIDGPFTESKELIASYALFEVKSIDEAVTDQAIPRSWAKVSAKSPIFEASDFLLKSSRPRLPRRRNRGARRWLRKPRSNRPAACRGP
jgi:hypothetical protein